MPGRTSDLAWRALESGGRRLQYATLRWKNIFPKGRKRRYKRSLSGRTDLQSIMDGLKAVPFRERKTYKGLKSVRENCEFACSPAGAVERAYANRDSPAGTAERFCYVS